MNYKTLVEFRATCKKQLEALSTEQPDNERREELLKLIQGLDADLRGYDREIDSMTSFTGNYPKR